MAAVSVSPEVTVISQATSAECWLASYQMMYVWKNKPKADVYSKLDAAEDCWPDYWKKEGIGTEDLLPAAKALGLTWGGGGKLDIEVLANYLKKGPIWAAGAWNSYDHVIVLTGCDDSGAQPTVTYVNPYTSSDGKNIYTRTLYWFNEGLGKWSGHAGQYQRWLV